MWPFRCSNVLIEKNEFKYANGPADSAGCHIDIGNPNLYPNPNPNSSTGCPIDISNAKRNPK